MIKNKLQLLTFIVFTALLTSSACKNMRIISTDADVIVSGSSHTSTTENTTGEGLPNENTEQQTTTNTVQEDTVKTETVLPIKKDRYKIAVVLPFMYDSVQNNWSKAAKTDFKDFETPEESEKAIAFYEGFAMALPTFNLNTKFDIKVYDTELQATTTHKIAAQLVDDSIDVIIGPFNSKNVKIITDMAKKHDITVISPFTPSTKASAKYYKYYMIEPSFKRHQEAIINYGLTEVENPHFKYLYQSNAFGKKNAQHFSSYIDSFNLNKDYLDQVLYSILEQDKDEVKDFKLSENMDSEKTNILIANSFDESFLSVFLQKLSKFKKDDNLISFGMPGWEDSQILRMSHLSNNKIHFTTSTWIVENDTTEQLIDSYKEIHNKTPRNEVFLGYDIATLFLPLLDKVGIDFNSSIIDKTYKGLNRNYKFTYTFDHENNMHIENAALHIYKIENFERILVK